MPKAAVALLEKQNIERTQQVLHSIINAYGLDICLRYSLKNLKKDDGLLNIPLFMVDYTEKLLALS